MASILKILIGVVIIFFILSPPYGDEVPLFLALKSLF